MSEPPPRAAQGTPSHQQQNTAAVRSTGVKEHNLNFTEQANRHEIGSWDQFEANKKLIQDASTYDDLMYTTPIPQHIPLNWQKKMEHKAQSIEKNPTSDHGRHNTKDEETAFASVRRNEILRRSQTGESSLKIKIRKETRLKKTPKKVKVILRSSDLTKANLGQADMSHDEGSESSSASGSDISEDDRVAEVAGRGRLAEVHAYVDDVNLVSNDAVQLSKAFTRLQALLKDFSLVVSTHKCLWFGGMGKVPMPQELCDAEVRNAEHTLKTLGAFIGEDSKISEQLLTSLQKHNDIFRRLKLMGLNNTSAKLLSKCVNVRQRYQMRGAPSRCIGGIDRTF